MLSEGSGGHGESGDKVAAEGLTHTLAENPALLNKKAELEQTDAAGEIIHDIEEAGRNHDKAAIVKAVYDAVRAGYLGPMDPEPGKEAVRGNLTPVPDHEGYPKHAEAPAIFDAAVEALREAGSEGKINKNDIRGKHPLEDMDVEDMDGITPVYQIIHEEDFAFLARVLEASGRTSKQLAKIRDGLEDRGLVAAHAKGETEPLNVLDEALRRAEGRLVVEPRPTAVPVGPEIPKPAPPKPGPPKPGARMRSGDVPASASAAASTPEATIGSDNKFTNNRSTDVLPTVDKRFLDAKGMEKGRVDKAKKEARAKIEALHDEAQAMNADIDKARADDQEKAEKSYESNIEATRRRESREIRDTEPLSRVTDPDRAHDQALALDYEVRSQQAVYQDFQNQIAERARLFQEMIDRAEGRDPNLARELRAARDEHMTALHKEGEAAVEAERVKQAENTKLAARVVSEVLVSASRHELNNYALSIPPEALRDRVAYHDFEDQALLRRMTLGVSPVPFLERKQGGLRVGRGDSGPRLIESYFRVPGHDNIVVVERYNRRSGDLVSQQILTSQQAIRDNGAGDVLPPRDISDEVVEGRQSDLKAFNNNKDRDYSTRLDDMWGGLAINERFNGSNSIYDRYASYSEDTASVARNRDALDRWHKNGRKRGGLLYRLGWRR